MHYGLFGVIESIDSYYKEDSWTSCFVFLKCDFLVYIYFIHMRLFCQESFYRKKILYSSCLIFCDCKSGERKTISSSSIRFDRERKKPNWDTWDQKKIGFDFSMHDTDLWCNYKRKKSIDLYKTKLVRQDRWWNKRRLELSLIKLNVIWDIISFFTYHIQLLLIVYVYLIHLPNSYWHNIHTLSTFEEEKERIGFTRVRLHNQFKAVDSSQSAVKDNSESIIRMTVIYRWRRITNSYLRVFV